MPTAANHLEQAIADRLGDETLRVARRRDEAREAYVLVPASNPQSVAVGPCPYTVALAHAIWWGDHTTSTSYFVRPATIAELRNA